MKYTENGFYKLTTTGFGLLAACCLGLVLLGQTARAETPINDLLPGAYQASYFDVSSSFTPSQQGYGGPGHSGGNGDALVRVVDVGNFEANSGGDLCINFYVFDDDQEMQECCSCPTTADEETTFSTINLLTSNPQFSSPLGVGVIKIVGSNDLVDCKSGGDGQLGEAGTLTVDELAEGLEAWINHSESIASNNPKFTPPFGFVTTTSVERFSHAPIDSGELASLTKLCSNIELHASGRGICLCKEPPPPPPPQTPLAVSLGYANSFNGGPPHVIPPPTPFGPGSVDFFLGVPNGPGNVFDAGAILLTNTSGQDLTLSSVTIDFGSTCTVGTGTVESATNCNGLQNTGQPTDPWAPGNPSGLTLPLLLHAGQTAILTQTNLNMSASGVSDFDTSDLPPGVSPPAPGACIADGVIPKLHFTFKVGGGSSQTLNINDTGQILNTGGVDLALCPTTPPCNGGATGFSGCGIEGHDYVHVFP